MDLLLDRPYISQYAIEHTGLIVYRNGVAADADNNDVSVSMFDADNVQVFGGRVLDHEDVGAYGFDLIGSDTAKPGYYDLVYEFMLDGTALDQTQSIEIGLAAPLYDSFTAEVKGVVDNVYWRFADLYDSPFGGPHLQVYVQTHFGRQRMAQIVRAAVGTLNTISQPHQTYSVDPGGPAFPVHAWGALLEQAAYIETIKHLRRSYVEQPSVEGVAVARFDRRDYMQRWGEILADEQDTFKGMLDTFKIANMGLGRPHVLVAGGAYGMANQVPVNLPARPRIWARFYA